MPSWLQEKYNVHANFFFLIGRAIEHKTFFIQKVYKTFFIQDSVFDLLLSLLYVSDLPHASNFDTTLFADDTSLHLSHHNNNILQSHVNQKINKINQWMKNNKLKINNKKVVT